MESVKDVLLLEPFYGGSHKQLIDLLMSKFSNATKFVLPAKKWHWRARTAALYFSQVIPLQHNFRTLFASSVLNLAELVALRPDLACLRKVIYFHENQLVYPVRKQQERDFQFGYNQILSCCVADIVVFNSKFNQESFLSHIKTFLNLIPDHRPKGIQDEIRGKCHVLYFPVDFPEKTGKPWSNQPNADNSVDETILEQSDNYLGCINSAKVGTRLSNTIQDFYPDDDAVPLHGFLIDKTDQNTKFDECTTNINEYRKHLVIARNEMGSLQDVKVSNKESKADEITAGYVTEGDILSSTDLPGSILNKKSDNEDKKSRDEPLHIVWPHRWEHDKDPEVLFKVLNQLHEEGLEFYLSVLGETFTDVPDVFPEAKIRLCKHVLNWGFVPSREGYHAILRSADVVVSTAQHEFFGVSMLEACHLGCYPLCPNRLVYPEIFPKEYLYNTDQQLFKRLRDFCRKPHLARNHHLKVQTELYTWDHLQTQYRDFLCYVPGD